MKSPMHQAALEYAARKWAVFPVQPPVLGDRESGKRPIGALVPNGKDDATTDQARIDAWWSAYPDANVGIACDKSGLVVLDVDVGLDTKGNQKKGLESLKEFDAQLTQTLTAITGGGGLHAIYDAAGAPLHALRLREGIDIIGHGYIVAAPSRHYSGGVYRWNDVRAVAALPEVIRAAVASQRAAGPERVALLGTPIPEGGRNNAMFRLGCALRDTGIGAEALARALDAENKQRAGLPDAELATIVNSVLNTVTPSRDVAIGAVVTQEIQQIFGPRNRAQRIIEIAKTREPPMRFYATGIEQFDKMSGGGLGAKRVCGVVAPPSTGKSQWVTSLALTVQKVIPVLHFSTELMRKEAQIRYAAPILGFPWRDGLKGLIPDDAIERAVAPLNVWIIGCDDYDRADPIGSLRTEALAIREQTGMAPLIIVDYVQSLARGAKDQARHAIGELSMALRLLAQELDCPLIAVFSCSRTYYGNTKEMERLRSMNDASAFLAAAKESGEIEYDCGTIIFLDVDYLAEGQPKAVSAAVARCRDGEIGFFGMRARLDSGVWTGDPAAVHELMSEERRMKREEAKTTDACAKLLEVIDKMPCRPWRDHKNACKGAGNWKAVEAAKAKLLTEGVLEEVTDKFPDSEGRMQKRTYLRVKLGEGNARLAHDVNPEEAHDEGP